MKIHCTEGKSVGALPRRLGNMVRVFVDGDYQYGYWVVEDDLLGLLDEAVQHEYLQAGAEFKTDVDPKLAQRIIDMGVTPYKKVQVA